MNPLVFADYVSLILFNYTVWPLLRKLPFVWRKKSFALNGNLLRDRSCDTYWSCYHRCRWMVGLDVVIFHPCVVGFVVSQFHFRWQKKRPVQSGFVSAVSAKFIKNYWVMPRRAFAPERDRQRHHPKKDAADSFGDPIVCAKHCVKSTSAKFDIDTT